MPIPEIEAALTSPTLPDHQHEVYRRLREQSPVYWSPALGQWLVTTYDLVERVLTDPGTFSSVGAELEHISALDPSVQEETHVLTDHFSAPQLNITDPPDHTRIRRAFGRSFVPRAVDEYAERIDQLAQSLLAKAAADGPVIDVMTQLAEPLPVDVVSDIIGIPESHRAAIPSITMDQRFFFGVASPEPDRARRFASRLEEWHELLTSLIEDRRRQPRQDVLTRAAQMIDEGRIELHEALATVVHLIIAGNGTTTGLIGNTTYLLISHPDQLAELQTSPDLMAGCVEESLRFEAPLPRDRRIAIEPCELGGEEIGVGERVVCVLASANRDPQHFENPDEFDIHRSFSPSQHAAFGRGIHFCLGAPVARLETAIAIHALLQHVPMPVFASGFQARWHSIPTHRALVSLPVTSARGPA